MIVRELVNLIGFKINETQFKRAESRVRSLQGSMERFGMRASLFLTAPFVGLNIWIAKTLSGFEQLDVSFETMLGSAEKADKLLKDLLQFAAKTPFEIKEIGGVAKQLLAVGIESEKVLPTLKSLGDVAAGLSVPVSRLALNYGQIKTQVRLTGRELRDFSIAGVPLLAELAKTLGKTEQEIKAMVSAGKIEFPAVEQAFKNMSSSGGRFANLMIKQSATLGGMWSNFKDLITLTVKEYSTQLLPMFKGIVKFGIRFLDYFKNELTPTLKRILFIFAALTATVGPLILAFSALVKVGLFVRTSLLAVSAAARIANLSTSLFLLKFALMGAALIGVLLLAIGFFEDISSFLKGQDSAIGRIIAKLNVLNEKLKSLGVFTLQNIKNTLKSIGDLIQSFMDTIVGLFTGRWKFALDSLVNLFADTFKTIGNIAATILQPVADIFNLITGSKANIANIPIEKMAQFSGMGGGFAPAPGMGASVSGGNFNTTVNLTLPNSPSPEQVNAVGDSVENQINAAIKKVSRNLVNAMPEVE